MSDIFEDNKPRNRLWDKIKKEPAPIIGLAGLAGVVGYSLFHFTKRDKDLKTSVYVIQTRVFAQGMVVGALTLGLLYHMYHTYNETKVVPQLPPTVAIIEPKDIKEIKK